MREPSFSHRRAPVSRHFVARLLAGLQAAMAHADDAQLTADRPGWLQRLDPRVKLIGLGALIFTAVAVHSLAALAGLLLSAVIMARLSAISLSRLLRQVWLGVLLFTGMLALPALFMVPGAPLLTLPFPPLTVTCQGLRSAALLVGRAETSATLTLLLVLTTSWPRLLKALRSLRVPRMAVMILGMTHRYIFVLLGSAMALFDARSSRMVGPLPPGERRRLAVNAAGSLLERSLYLSQEVHLAMLSRGFRGEIRLMDDLRLQKRDWRALPVFMALALAGFACQWLRLP
ncbi:cobalt ECF transporter T component CbiQ [Acerihabitans arboris]|uniref:Cobalt ECF transporter T component CbiQ n=1 Tax=Acerihabitans arboris TaxID=2691583 RepID=A0A845SN02_9GAMM|nr:cobalt ECF transporter T component CbiQ [Acerihabitans arboris]NDL63991.1 cobalt ECF transporter T component CbiQ [Acerihabitans arboris]